MTIELSQGKTALVDPEDFEKLSCIGWHADIGRTTIYAKHTTYDPSTRKFGRVLMHRFILGVTDPKILVDHVNGDGLDNRKENLRVASPSTNRANHQTTPRGKSGYHGVSYRKERDAWVVSVTKDYKRHFGGYFKSREDAARRYNELSKQLFGEFACLNEVSA